MMTGPDGDPAAVDDRAHVVGVHVAHVEGDHPTLGLRVAGSVDVDPGDVPEALHRVAGELDLVLPDRLHADGIEVVDGGPQGDGLGERWRAGLELVGNLVPRRVVDPDVADHVAAAVEGLHLLEERLPAPQEADAGRGAHLVPGADVEVAPEGGDVHGEVGRRLGAVTDDDRPGFVGLLGDLGDRIDRPENVRDVPDGHDAGPVRKHPVEGVEVEGGLVLDRDRPERRAGVPACELPGHDVGVVLHLGGDDLVALGEAVPCPGVGEEVEALGGGLREDDPPRAGRPDELGNLAPGTLVEHGGSLPQGVHRTVHIRVVLLIEALQLVDDLARLLRGGCVVQVAERVAVDLLVQNRKVLANLSCIHGRIVPLTFLYTGSTSGT